jgi:hypothetical protein
MPFSTTIHENKCTKITITEEQWTHIFERWIKRAVESFKPHQFQCVRSAPEPGNFIKGIVHDLFESDIVIADLTGSRPNVYYELGIRHGLETGTIIITQDWKSVPSDLRAYYAFRYDYTVEHHLYDVSFASFEKQMHEKLSSIFRRLNPSDNPVSDFLGHQSDYIEYRFQEEKREIVFLIHLFRDIIQHELSLCESLLYLKKHGKLKRGGPALLMDFYPFDLLLGRLVNTRWHHIPMDLLEQLNNLIHQTRRSFLPIHQGWHILRINPTSEANKDFFDLVEAVLLNKGNDYRRAVNEIVNTLENLRFEINFTPRKFSLRAKR